MKTTIKILFLAISLFFCGISQAQLKLGHINSSELMKAMPETDSAEIKIKKYAAELESTIQTMRTELENKYREYQSSQDKWSDLIKASKQRELQDLQGRMEEFANQADQDYSVKRQEMLEPIVEKAKQAIETVAKENKYNYVFDTSGGTLIYSEASDDLMSLVKKRMGLK